MKTTMINVNTKKLRGLLDAYNAEHGTSIADLCRQLGRAESYMHAILARGTITPAAMKMMSVLFDIKPEDYVKTVEDEEPEEPVREDKWDFQVEILPDSGCVKARILCGGETVVYGFARIKQPQTNLAIAQAVSYATHICYKKAEQVELEGSL